jgi:hypothetical protein
MNYDITWYIDPEYIKEQANALEEKIRGLEETLKLMPEGTFLGRMCIKSYIKRYKKELDRLKEDWPEYFDS